MHFIAHILGLDTQQSYWYDFWSGVATQASVVLGYIALRWEIRKIRDEERWHNEERRKDED